MNNKYKDITGQRFNRLIAVKPLYTKKGRGMFWEFMCICGKSVVFPAGGVKSGNTKSCGCMYSLAKIGNKNSFKNLINQRFGRLLVLREATFAERPNKNKVYWECLCDCGNIKLICANHLPNGTTLSCGCLQKEIKFKHGMYYTRTYKRWAGMLQRCTNENRPDYNYYGNRGIRVCDKWLNFKGFYEDMGDCPEKLTLDRIDTNGNYCKENCRWADRKTQSRNTRKNRIITFNGQTKCVSEWAEITGIKYITLIDRLERNWPNQKLFDKVRKKQNKNEDNLP